MTGDRAAGALAERIGGEASVRFAGGPANEFDAVSEQYVAQAKPANFTLNKAFRDQSLYRCAAPYGVKIPGAPAGAVPGLLRLRFRGCRCAGCPAPGPWLLVFSPVCGAGAGAGREDDSGAARDAVSSLAAQRPWISLAPGTVT